MYIRGNMQIASAEECATCKRRFGLPSKCCFAAESGNLPFLGKEYRVSGYDMGRHIHYRLCGTVVSKIKRF